MSHPTFPRPLDPAVRKNPFRDQSFRAQNILSFSEARERLPVPVIFDHPEWVEMYWRAWEMAWSNLRRPKPSSGLIANFIDTAFNENTFMWDSAFMVQFGLYGRRAFGFMGTLDNFYAKQHNDGYICREINTEMGYDFFHPFDPNGTGPNILAWAEWRYFRLTGDDSRLDRVFWPLLAFHRWFRSHRTWPNGLYWATGLSSGMDNQTRVPDSSYHHRHWTWVDATMQAALNCHILSQMAATLDENELAEPLIQERQFLIREINARLWDEAASFYKDSSPDGRFSPVKSIGAYWALLDKEIIPAERLEPFLQHLRDTEAFNRPHPIPSQSADSPDYDDQTGAYWRGGVWSPTNHLVFKGLRALGKHRLAHQLAVNHIKMVGQVFEHTDTFWENYAPESAAPGEPAKPGFVGWTGLSPIAILLEDIIGISVDWPLRRVSWDRSLATDAPYGVENYPLGSDGTVSLVGDAAKVVVRTTSPFTLTIRHGEGSLQTAVPAGTTEIDLS